MLKNGTKNKLKQSHIFERGQGDWDKLLDFMDKNNFSALDFMACVCANMSNYPNFSINEKYQTELMLQGVKFKIKIEPELF